MTDQEKVIKLLKELGVEFEVEGNTIFVEPFYCDGAEEFGISFWDGEDFPKGEFHEFWVVPFQQTLKSTPEVSFEYAQCLFDEWVEYTEKCLKEHNWRFLGYITWLIDVKKLPVCQVEKVIKLTSRTGDEVD